MPALAVQVPRIRQESATSARVTQWGHVGAFVLRAGDRLVLAEPTPGALLLLVPRGWGNPMLGRQRGATLIAEPGGVPASAARWQVAGRIVAIERDLERAVVGGGRWAVSVVFHPTRAATVGQLRDAELRFQGGWMDGAQLDAFCLQAALAADDLGVEISVGAAEGFDVADSLAALASPGTVRIEPFEAEQPERAQGQLIRGPWQMALGTPSADALERQPAPGRVQLSLFSDSRRHHGS